MFVCEACGGQFLASQRDAHEQLWCPAGDSEEELQAMERSAMPSSHGVTLGEEQLCVPREWSLGVVEATLSVLSTPLKLSFAEQSVFGDFGTGGGLWHCELVMAELCLERLARQRQSSQSGPTQVIELGCGVAPAAGLACLSAGCDVLFTDVEAILPLTEDNIRRNCPPIVQSRQRPRDGLQPCCAALTRRSCDTCPLWFGRDLPSRVLEVCGAAADLLVVCSDCVYRPELHAPLAQTLFQLLSEGVGAVMVGFILREHQDLGFVSQACPEEGLQATRLSTGVLREALRDAPWQPCSSLAEHCHVYDIALA